MIRIISFNIHIKILKTTIKLLNELTSKKKIVQVYVTFNYYFEIKKIQSK
jgi:hypothetical protein